MPHQWQWTLLRAGALHLDGGAMFGILPKPLWAAQVSVDLQNRIRLQTNCLLLTGEDGRRVVVEAGYGNKFSPKEVEIYGLEHRTITDALREVGIAAAEIDDVVLTHLHFDHAGGLTHLPLDADGAPDPTSGPRPTFPNATIHVQRREWEDALANRSTMTRTYLRNHLDPIAHQVKAIDGEAEVLPGLRVRPVPGHTWGQQAILFEDGEGGLVFPGDVMPTVHHAHLAASMAYDMLPYENMLTKRALFEECVRREWRWILDHEPGSPVVRIEREGDRGDRYRLVSVADDAEELRA